jgi:hypothetical protein
MPRLVEVVLIGGCLTLPLVAGAQTCQGVASFGSGPARVGAALDVSDNVKTYGAQLAVGAATGPFASASLSRAEYDNVTNAGVGIGVTGGFAIAVTQGVQFCPLASFGYESGPDVGSSVGTVSSSAHAVGFGGSFGGTVPATPSVDFVPSIGAQYVIQQASATALGTSVSSSTNFTAIQIGAGFVFNRTVTLRPAVSIPVGLTSGKSTFELVFAFNFGSSSAKP